MPSQPVRVTHYSVYTPVLGQCGSDGQRICSMLKCWLLRAQGKPIWPWRMTGPSQSILRGSLSHSEGSEVQSSQTSQGQEA